MIYVMSDIHGCDGRYRNILKQIKLKADDHLARYDRLNVFAIFLFMETNPQPFPCLSRLRKHIYCVFDTIGRREHIHS